MYVNPMNPMTPAPDTRAVKSGSTSRGVGNSLGRYLRRIVIVNRRTQMAFAVLENERICWMQTSARGECSGWCSVTCLTFRSRPVSHIVGNSMSWFQS